MTRRYNLLKNLLEFISSYIYIVDRVISSIQSRFEQFRIYANILGFLFNFMKLKSLDNDGL